MKVTTHQTVVETTNILLQIMPKFTTYVIYRTVFTTYSCCIQFQFMLVTALSYFHEIDYDPQVILPYQKMALPPPPKKKTIKILKMSPQQNSWPRLTGKK